MKMYAIEKPMVDLSVVDDKFIEKMFSLNADMPKPVAVSEIANRNFENKEVSVKDFLADVENGKIMKPDYQRPADRHSANLSKWLEFSLINGYPVPPIILIKSGEKFALADGQQRTVAILERIAQYDAVIAKCNEGLADEKAEAKAKESLAKIRDKMQSHKEKLLNAKITLFVHSGVTRDEELYIYAALNAAKPQTGGEKAFAFLPESAIPFVYDITKDLLPLFGNKSGATAAYIWAACQAKVGKCAAGAKVFPILKAESNQENYSPVNIPAFWTAILEGIKSRPADNKVDMPQATFAKAGYIVPLVQGVRLWGVGDENTIRYLLKNLDKYIGQKVTIQDKPGKGKNGPAMSTRIASSFLSMSGSGEAVVYKRTQTWYKLLKMAAKDLAENPAEENDEMAQAMAEAEKQIAEEG